MKILYIFFMSIPLIASDSSFNQEMQEYITQLKIEALKIDKNFEDFDMKRGEKIFTTKHLGKRGKEISCTSCHSINLMEDGKNIFTNKEIKPLSPSVNKKRLSSVKEVKKWLRRNFKDVFVREGTPQEKGDVLYYINSK